MKIRSYRKNDYPKLKKLLVKNKLFDKLYDTPEKLNKKSPKGSIIVAEDNGKIIGCIFFTWDYWDSSIFRLAVDSNYKRKGIGSRLLSETEKRLRKLGADVASLRVHTKNKEAINFFKKKGYYLVGGPYLDLEKRL